MKIKTKVLLENMQQKHNRYSLNLKIKKVKILCDSPFNLQGIFCRTNGKYTFDSQAISNAFGIFSSPIQKKFYRDEKVIFST